MLESVGMSLFDEGYQRGFEIGISESSLHFLTVMTKQIKTCMSEEQWERYKKQEEERHRRYLAEHPDGTEVHKGCYDEKGHLIKEKWMEEQIVILECMKFPKGCREDICMFIEKYPALPPGMLARRIIRESEYKYI